MQKGVGDVELIHRPVLVGSDCEHCSNGARLDHRCKGLAEINSSTPGKPAHHSSCLVLFKAAVGPEFVFENPLPGNDIGP
jgi:hypothetical protein